MLQVGSLRLGTEPQQQDDERAADQDAGQHRAREAGAAILQRADHGWRQRADADAHVVREPGADAAGVGGKPFGQVTGHHAPSADRQKAPLVTIDRSETVEKAAHILTENAYSQIPVTADGRLVGSVNEGYLYSEIVKNPASLHGPVEAIMQPAFPFADISTSVDALAGMLTPDSPAVLVRDFKLDATYIITRWDIIKALA